MRWWRIFGLAGWLIVRVQTKSEPQARLACIPKKAIVIAKGLFVGWRELVYLKKEVVIARSVATRQSYLKIAHLKPFEKIATAFVP